MNYPPHAEPDASPPASVPPASTNGHIPHVVNLSTRVTFRFDSGRAVELAVVDAYYEFADLAKEMGAVEGATHKDYLRELGRRINGWFGVELTLGELDELNEAVAVAYLAKKKQQESAIAGLLTLPSSTASGRPG